MSIQTVPEHSPKPKTPVLTNWMKNVTTQPKLVVEPASVAEVQEIVRNSSVYPSPVRAAGQMASPSAVHLNDGGTVIIMKKLDKIHGLKKITLPDENNSEVTCIDTDCSVTLRELQKYAHSKGFEVPFSAEIGFATIGGTAMTTTKDSSIGENPIPGMGMGDVGSCVYGITLVTDDGKLKEHRVIDEDTGKFDPYFQGLLDSCGTQGIGVRFLIVLRPKTSLTTTVHLFRPPRNQDDVDCVIKNVLKLEKNASNLQGNVFATFQPIGSKRLMWVEERIPEATKNKMYFAPLSLLLGPLIVRVKKFLIQRCLTPFWMYLLYPLSGSFLLRFKQSSRAPGNSYTLDVPENKRKLTFSYYAFPHEDFTSVVSEGLAFTEEHRKKTGFTPDGFATYFVKPNGKRLAGPYKGPDTGIKFSFDPIYHSPNDPKWKDYVDAFNEFAKSKGGRASINQTLGLHKDAAFGGEALWGNPSPRFTTEWLQKMFNARV